MKNRLIRALSWFRRHPWYTLIILGVLGGGGYFAFPYLEGSWTIWSARRALGKGRLEDARKRLEPHLVAWPEDVNGHFLAAQAARRQRRYSEAVHHLDTCERLGGATTDTNLERTLIQVQKGNSGVVEYLRSLLADNHVHSLLILEALAEGCITTYHFPEAIGCLGQVLQKDPEQINARVRRGWVFEHLGHGKDAQDDYQQATNLDENDVDSRLGLARVLLHRKDLKGALNHYQRLFEKNPRHPETVLGLARCQRGLGDADGARALLDSLLPLATEKPGPADFQILCERARIALDDQQPGKAKPLLDQALKHSPFDRDGNFLMIQCLKQMDRKEEAGVLEEKLGQIERDLKMLQEAQRLATEKPRDPEPRCQAGEICLRLGLKKNAFRWLQSALQEDPEHSRTREVLGKYFE